MDLLRTYYINEYRNQPQIESVLFINSQHLDPMHEGFDKLVLIIYRASECKDAVIYNPQWNECIKELWITCEQAECSICNDEPPHLLYWMMTGEVVFDGKGFIEKLRHQLQTYPEQFQLKKLLVEFARFLRSYAQCKHCLESNQIHDAYHYIMDAMHRWARIVILEQGRFPDVNVWKQVKQFNPGVYKLYEELAESTETLRQRIELVLLASEFSMISRMERCTRFLIELIGSRKEPWSPSELMEQLKLPALSQDLAILLNKMAVHKLVKIVTVDNGYCSTVKYKL